MLGINDQRRKKQNVHKIQIYVKGCVHKYLKQRHVAVLLASPQCVPNAWSGLYDVDGQFWGVSKALRHHFL